MFGTRKLNVFAVVLGIFLLVTALGSSILRSAGQPVRTGSLPLHGQ